ncbi:hypothetical protein Q9189_002309 [Teloschistes chrysophthalmus]
MPGSLKRQLVRTAPMSSSKRVKASSPSDEPESTNTKTDPSATQFCDLGIIEPLCDACSALGYKTPTPIQKQAIPLALQGRDLIGLAETGSGKTAAYALPILQALMDKPQNLFSLVMAPTRELAYQISQAFEALGSLINVRSCVIVGGMDMVPQAIALGKKPHVVVATPGRLLDHLENTRGFSLRGLKYLVMDEADRLLDLDFGDIIDKILKGSACHISPLRVSISTNKYQTVSTLLQNYLFLPHKDKDLYLVYLLTRFTAQSIIVFTRTVNEAQRLALLARSLNMKAIPLHGQLSQTARLGALGKFRAGESVNILIATDVAARGLDIPSVDVVINFDLPPDSKTYIHRVGRTARAGKSGKALSLVTQYDVEIWQRIENSLGKKLGEYETEKDEVMVFGETVNEAQREAIRKMKDLHEKRGTPGATLRGRKPGGGKGRRKGRDEMDRDEG